MYYIKYKPLSFISLKTIVCFCNAFAHILRVGKLFHELNTKRLYVSTYIKVHILLYSILQQYNTRKCLAPAPPLLSVGNTKRKF